MAIADQLRHVTEEEGQQQRANVRAIYIGVAHDDDTTVAQFRHVEVFINANTDGGNDILDLLIFEDLVESHALNVQDLTTQWQDGLKVAVAPLLGRATCGIALDEIEFATIGASLAAIGELAGQRRVQHVFALDEIFGGTGCLAGTGGGETFVDDGLALARRSLQVLREHVGGDRFDDWAHIGIVELALGLRLELRIRDLDADDGGQPLAHVVAGQIAVLLFEQVDLARVVVERAREGAAEASDVHAAIDCIDAVCEGVFGAGPAIVILERNLDLDAIDFAEGADGTRLQGVSVLVQVAHK